MSTPLQQFTERWRAERSLYDAWGKFVSSKVLEVLNGFDLGSSVNLFIRIPAKHRIKEEGSLIEKAFLRKKYENPYDDVEDKVGVRFVVLLTSDVRLVERAIVSSEDYWTSSLARDFEAEKQANPSVFQYQSLHYVVRSKAGIEFDGLKLLENMPCEIQVRTLLQHAYSELTHDTIYKPSVRATPEMERAASKSMALIEATDDYFSQVVSLIREASKSADEVRRDLATAYEVVTGRHGLDTPFNTTLIDFYKKFTSPTFDNDLTSWLKSKSYFGEFVKSQAETDTLYRLPAVLLVGYSISVAPRSAATDSPLSDDELQPIYSILGEALNG